MPHTFRVALLGFSDFERSTMASYFRLAAQGGRGYELVGADDDSDFILADADHAPSVQLVVAAERLRDTVFIGSQPPADAVAWTLRPIDPLQVMRELDTLRREARGPAAAPAAAAPAPADDDGAAMAAETAPAADDAAAPPGDSGGDASAAPAVPTASEVLRDFFADDPPLHEPPPADRTDGQTDPPSDPQSDPPNVDSPADDATGANAAGADGPATAGAALPLPEVTEVAETPAASAEPDLLLDLHPHAQPWQAVPEVPLAAPAAGPPSALIVDDSAIALRFLASRLEPWGLTMDCVVNSTQALECLAERDYDFIFLDVELGSGSDLDGLALCQRIKREYPLSLATLVIVSAHFSELDRVRGSLAGCDAYLAKPLQAVELARLLARSGLKPPPAAAALLRRKAPA